MNTPIEYDRTYHIFNRGNNYENTFIDIEDYRYFLNLYRIYIDIIADTYSWCLLKNHFHILVKIKAEDEIGYLNSINAHSEDSEEKWKIYYPEKPGGNFKIKPKPSEQFQHLFSTYARYFNKKYGRVGSLFIKNYHRIRIDDSGYFTTLIIYIHKNPVNHGFAEQIADYPWSSYHTIVSDKKTKLRRDEVINSFEDLENFLFMHRVGVGDDEGLNKYLIE
jgi:putative transposase